MPVISLLLKRGAWKFFWNLNHFVLHLGTNDLNSEQSPEFIAKSIADIAASL